MPKLKTHIRIMLYICMILCCGLSIATLFVNEISLIIQIPVHCLAALSLISGIYYLIGDIRYLVCNVILSEINRNKYIAQVIGDYRLRTVLFTIPGAGINVLYAMFHGVMAIVNRSAWLGTLCAYYLVLSIMRIRAVTKERALRKIDGKERMRQEIDIYKKSSFFFVFLAIVMVGMVILLLHSQGGKTYPGYMIYVAALYAFYKIILSIINMMKVKKEESPLLSIIRRIGNVDACVSILTLQTAMFAAFSDGRIEYQNLMNGLTGIAVCILVFGMGVFGILQTGKLKEKYLEQEMENYDDKYISSRR